MNCSTACFVLPLPFLLISTTRSLLVHLPRLCVSSPALPLLTVTAESFSAPEWSVQKTHTPVAARLMDKHIQVPGDLRFLHFQSLRGLSLKS